MHETNSKQASIENKRTTTSTWNGTLKEGNGVMRLQSGAYEGPFTFLSRFEEGEGTN